MRKIPKQLPQSPVAPESAMSDNCILTPEEWSRLEWCFAILEEEDIRQCEDKAHEIACVEVYGPKARKELLPLLVKLRVDDLRKR